MVTADDNWIWGQLGQVSTALADVGRAMNAGGMANPSLVTRCKYVERAVVPVCHVLKARSTGPGVLIGDAAVIDSMASRLATIIVDMDSLARSANPERQRELLVHALRTLAHVTAMLAEVDWHPLPARPSMPVVPS